MNEPTSPFSSPLSDSRAGWRLRGLYVLLCAAAVMAVAIAATVSAVVGYAAGESAAMREAWIEASRVCMRDAAADTRTAEQLRQLNVSASRLATAFERTIPTPKAGR